MEIHLMLRRQKTTIFTSAREDSTALHIKKIIKGVLKVDLEDIKLYSYNARTSNHKVIKEDKETLGALGYNSRKLGGLELETLAFVLRKKDGEWEDLQLHPLSTPPEVPEALKYQAGQGEFTAEPTTDNS